MIYGCKRFFITLSIPVNFLFLFCIYNNIPLYASQDHLTVNEKGASLEKPPLTPSALFANIADYPENVENKRLEALKQGIQRKLINDHEGARTFFEEAASLDSPSAMHHLGMFDPHNKTEWFILAFQVHWIQTGKHLSCACSSLQNLTASDNKAVSFLKDLKQRYPENGNTSRNLYMKADELEKALEEPYLSEQERTEKAFRFLKAVNDQNGYRQIAFIFFAKKMGRCFTEAEQAEHAIVYALRSKDPLCLHNAGVYYSTGQAGTHLGQEERYEKAFNCFIDAQSPLGFYDAAMLLDQGKVKKPNAVKLAESYYQKSNLPNALYNLAILWRDGRLGNKQRYQNAVKFFITSNLPTGKYNAAVLYRDGLTGNNLPQGKRDEKAISLLLEAESSVPLAKAVLGCMYKQNQGVPSSVPESKRLAEAERFLEAACKHNIVSAFYNLGLMYQFDEAGLTLSKRERTQKAFGLFMKAYKLSESTGSKSQTELSKVQIATMLLSKTDDLEGSQAEKDKEAFRLLCECVSAESKLLKGSILLEGRALLDLSEDARYNLAQECFEQANSPASLYQLGLMYWSGKAGKELNRGNRLKKTIELFRASSTAEAKADHGLLLYENLDVETNLYGEERDQVIIKLFQESDTDIAKAGLGAMYLHGRAGKHLLPAERDQKASILFNEAQTPASYNNLAKLYIEERLGTELPKTDRIQKAKDYLMKAIQPRDIFTKGCAAAYLNLGLLYILEESIRDIDNALHLFHLAALEGMEQAAVYRDTLLEKLFAQEHPSSPLKLEEIIGVPEKTSSLPTTEIISTQEKLLIETHSTETVEVKAANNRESDPHTEAYIPPFNSSKEIKELKKRLKQYSPEAIQHKKLFKKSLNKELTCEEKGKLFSSTFKSVNNKIKIKFIRNAEKQYNSWKQQNGYQTTKIDDLIREVFINPDSKRGKPEALQGDLKGWYSRRIDDEHRLVYKLTPDGILIKSCKKHYY